MGVIFELLPFNYSPDVDFLRETGSQITLNMAICNRWPSSVSPAPKDVPLNIGNFFEQGTNSLKSKNWDAAGAMFRKTLDVGTKLLEPEYKSKPLFQRIESLVSDGKLTPAMGEWSHEVRLDGNEAVHGEEPETEADAVALQKFVEAFLTYSFTLPAMVTANRAKRAVDAP